MVNPVNWRIAHKSEVISLILKENPPIYKGRNLNAKYGVENFIFMFRGLVYLAPSPVSAKFSEIINTDHPFSIWDMKNQNTGRPYETVPFTLLKQFMENDPHILVKKFPTKLLILILKRHSKQQIKNLKNKPNEEVISDVDSAIRSDLSKSYKPEDMLPRL